MELNLQGQGSMYASQPLVQKGRLRTLSSTVKLRNFDTTQKIRQLNVHVGCIISMPFMGILHNISWRGLCVAYPE